MHDLAGSVPVPAVPETLARLVRLRLMTELLDNDGDLAAELCTAGSLAALARTIRPAVTARLGCAGASLVLLDGNQCFGVDADPVAPAAAGRRYPVTECLAYWSILYNQVAVISDVDFDERVPSQAHRSGQVRSMVTAPIPGPSGPLGALCGYWPNTREARRAEVGRLQQLARAASAVVIGLGGTPGTASFRTRFAARRW